MTGYTGNIEELTLQNANFRQVLYTPSHMQLVLMSLKPLEDLGLEIHETIDQFFRIEKGQGKIVMNGEETELKDGSAVVVPAGTEHNLINTSETEDLKLYTIYSPPNHPADRVQLTREQAMAEEDHH
ncbi:cupin domain-containing protein [Candidatus Parcubacteria bacterium]|nr:cupin domain-containing protein [Patescibacteria group bacterium]MCG2689054.1 cupin domain-containing protein [Candidatus Parcubacteria bacterium]